MRRKLKLILCRVHCWSGGPVVFFLGCHDLPGEGHPKGHKHIPYWQAISALVISALVISRSGDFSSGDFSSSGI